MFLKSSMLLHTFLNWSLKVLRTFNEAIFCNHAVITVLLFRSLVCSRNITDMLGSSEMSGFVRLDSAKPIIFHKGGRYIYSIMFLWLLISLENTVELLVCIPSKPKAVIQCLSIYFPLQYASVSQGKPFGLGMVRNRRVISGF